MFTTHCVQGFHCRVVDVCLDEGFGWFDFHISACDNSRWGGQPPQASFRSHALTSPRALKYFYTDYTDTRNRRQGSLAFRSCCVCYYTTQIHINTYTCTHIHTVHPGYIYTCIHIHTLHPGYIRTDSVTRVAEKDSVAPSPAIVTTCKWRPVSLS